MKPKPTLTPSHRAAIARAGLGQRAEEARQRRFDELEQRGRRLQRDSDRRLEELHRMEAWMARAGPWIGRLALLPLLAFAIIGVGIVGHGLWTGEVHTAQRYQSGLVSRAGDPVLFWFSIAYHAAIVAFLGWLIRLSVRAALRRS